MPNWFQRVSLPDRFKDKSPEEIEAAIKALEDENAAIKGAQAQKPEDSEAFKTLQGQLTATQQQLQQLEQQRSVQTTTINEPPKRTSFLEDEDRAFAERANPIITQTFINGSLMAQQIARQDLLEAPDSLDKASNEYVLKNYNKEVNELYNSMPLNVRQDPNAYKNVVGVVKNRHFSDVIKATVKPGQGFEGAAGATAGNGPANTQTGPEKELTAGQLRVANKMGIKPADYLKSLKSLKVTQESGGYAEVKV